MIFIGQPLLFMRQTSILEKLLPSVINVAIIFALATPFLFYWPIISIKIILVILFFVYNFIFLFFTESGKDIGMIIVGSYWLNNYNSSQKFLYCILYTLSFASLLYWIYFPLDIFLVNMLLLQLPCILISSTTLHGLLAGKMVTAHRIGPPHAGKGQF